MLGKRSAQWGLFEADTLYGEFVGKRTFYGYLASQRRELFCDEDFAPLYCPNNGRPSVPPSLLATALVLQAYDGVSDDEATRRAGCATVCQEHAPRVSSAVDRARPDTRHFPAKSGGGQAARSLEKRSCAAGAATHEAGVGYDAYSGAWRRQG